MSERQNLTPVCTKIQDSFETPVFTQIADSGKRADSYGEQVRTSKAGDRATGESRDTFRTRVQPNSATSEGKAGAIAACSHVLPPDAQCHWSISQFAPLPRGGLKKLHYTVSVVYGIKRKRGKNLTQ